MSDRVSFTCNGAAVDVDASPGDTLLTVLREQLGLVSVKDGCAPQGQCGCCTVLVDGAARVACVTPVARVRDRSVTTLEGLPVARREALAAAFTATGASQCGFCTPGILLRVAALPDVPTRAELDRALAAHLCRCTGWQTIYEAVDLVGAIDAGASGSVVVSPRDLAAAARRATLEGGAEQRVGVEVTQGSAGFADDSAPPDALVAVPLPSGIDAEAVEAAGHLFVVRPTLAEAREAVGSSRGHRSGVSGRAPLALPPCPPGGVRLATGWVEPAYLEPDASWCVPGGEPASPLSNGGAFGAKQASPAAAAARELAERLGRPVRVVFSREDTVRLGPKRPPVAASAVLRDGRVVIEGVAAGADLPTLPPELWPYRLDVDARWRRADVAGPPVSTALRAVGPAEHAVLVEGALTAAGVDRATLVREGRAAAALLDTCAIAPGGAAAGAAVTVDDDSGGVAGITVRLAAGDPLDAVVLRSYAIGAAHMALGWVLTEGLAVDPETGEVLDLTVRSFGVVRPKAVPPIVVEIVDDTGPALGPASDAVFAAVAAATWNAVARAESDRPEAFPARETRAARLLSR